MSTLMSGKSITYEHIIEFLWILLNTIKFSNNSKPTRN